MNETSEQVLGEEAQEAVAELLLLDHVASSRSEALVGADMILDTVAPHVAALVAQAHAEGAAEERERIAAECDEQARLWARPGSFQPTSSSAAFEHAASIARAQS